MLFRSGIGPRRRGRLRTDRGVWRWRPGAGRGRGRARIQLSVADAMVLAPRQNGSRQCARLTRLAAAYPEAAQAIPGVVPAIVEACQVRTRNLLRQR